MQETVREFFESFGTILLYGEFDVLTVLYDYPFPTFVQGEIRVERTPDDLWEFMTARRRHAQAAGVRAVKALIDKIEPLPRDRFRVALQMSFRDGAGAEISRNTSRYLCRLDRAGDVFIESVEILDLGLPFPNQSDYVPRH